MSCASKYERRSLLSTKHEILLYAYLQHSRSGVDFLLYRESHLLPSIEFECEIGPLTLCFIHKTGQFD